MKKSFVTYFHAQLILKKKCMRLMPKKKKQKYVLHSAHNFLNPPFPAGMNYLCELFMACWNDAFINDAKRHGTP